ncbi:MAG TPA: DUF1801 domain-containing protein [Acidimicrobiia bacterium]|jgi:uncharacterized protein YdhG (YjbR/CyaY superfamily)
MHSNATSVEAYLAELPADRREAIEEVREVILSNLEPGFEEIIDFGMLAYSVPLERYPDTYNGHPIGIAGLASQKNHMSLYLMTIYADEESRRKFEHDYRETGKRYDVGKSCVRFRKAADLPLDVIAGAIAGTTVDDVIEFTERLHPRKPRG